MPFGHEQRDVDLVAVHDVTWPYATAKRPRDLDRRA
jgi:hypothetical protein